MAITKAKAVEEPRTRQQESRQRHERILQAAREQFAERGLKEVKISDIAAQAEVANGLLYQFYSSKQELYDAIIKQTLEVWLDTVEIHVENLEGSGLDKLVASVRQMLTYAYSQPELNKLLNRDSLAAVKDVQAISRIIEQAKLYTLGILELGVSDGSITLPTDLQATADIISEILNVYSTRIFNYWSPDELDQSMIDRVVDFVVAACASR